MNTAVPPPGSSERTMPQLRLDEMVLPSPDRPKPITPAFSIRAWRPGAWNIETDGIDIEQELVFHANVSRLRADRTGAEPGANTFRETPIRDLNVDAEDEYVRVAGEVGTLESIRLGMALERSDADGC